MPRLLAQQPQPWQSTVDLRAIISDPIHCKSTAAPRSIPLKNTKEANSQRAILECGEALQKIDRRLILKAALGNDGGKRLKSSISISMPGVFRPACQSTCTCARACLSPSPTWPYQFPGIRPYARCISAVKRISSTARWH
jgi:hypothetical protein